MLGSVAELIQDVVYAAIQNVCVAFYRIYHFKNIRALQELLVN